MELIELTFYQCYYRPQPSSSSSASSSSPYLAIYSSSSSSSASEDWWLRLEKMTHDYVYISER